VALDLAVGTLVGGVGGRIGAGVAEDVEVAFVPPGSLANVPAYAPLAKEAARDGTALAKAARTVTGVAEFDGSKVWVALSMRDPQTPTVIRHEMMHALIKQTTTSELAERLGLVDRQAPPHFIAVPRRH